MHYKTDILIIGAGITGCSLARELSRYQAEVAVIDRGSDLAEGATKANSGIVHAGYDAKPGTNKARLNVLGAEMFPELCKRLGVPYRRSGALVIALSEDERAVLEELLERGRNNGVRELSLLSREEALAMEPRLNPALVAALSVPTSGIVSPYELAFAMADDAAVNGVRFFLNREAAGVCRAEGGFRVAAGEDVFECRVLVNCSGASAAAIHNDLTGDSLEMIHRRGQYYLLDHAASDVFSRTIFQCPSAMGKGVLLSPTVHGNLLIGPTAEDIPDPLDTATTQEGLDNILLTAKKTWPDLNVRANITNFSGVRAHLTTDDFLIGPVASCPGAFEAVGIESPGLSSAPAVGQELAGQIAEYLALKRKDHLNDYVLPPKPFREMTDAEKSEACRRDPDYGSIICRCEVVTEAEIRSAIRRPVGARTIDGVKRRTRAGMGRCQGGFCLPRVATILAEELHCDLSDIRKDGSDSFLVTGPLADPKERKTV